MIQLIQSLDEQIILLIEKHLNHESIQVFFSLMTELNDHGLLTILATLLIIYKYNNPKVTKICLYSIVLSLIVVQLLGKNIIQRPRPFEVINGINLFVEKPYTYSFPSGHASFSGIGFMLSYYYLKNRITKYFFLLCFVLIAISRLILKVHFLSDILVGFFIALFIVFYIKNLVDQEYINK